MFSKLFKPTSISLFTVPQNIYRWVQYLTSQWADSCRIRKFFKVFADLFWKTGKNWTFIGLRLGRFMRWIITEPMIRLSITRTGECMTLCLVRVAPLRPNTVGWTGRVAGTNPPTRAVVCKQIPLTSAKHNNGFDRSFGFSPWKKKKMCYGVRNSHHFLNFY